MSKTDDRERVNQLIGSTAAAAHPAKNLMCGKNNSCAPKYTSICDTTHRHALFNSVLNMF